MDKWVEVGPVTDFEPHQQKNAKGVVVFNTNDGFYSCESRCPHMGYPMNKGTIREGVVTCAWHNWQLPGQ